MRHVLAVMRDIRAAIPLIAVLLVLAGGAPARAEFGIAAFDQQITADEAGSPFTQAGGHPYAITTEIDLNSHHNLELEEQPLTPDADAKDIVVELPPGLFGNPAGIAQCTERQLIGQFYSNLLPEAACPPAAQMGTVGIRSSFAYPAELHAPLYNMVPPANMPAAFGFNVAGAIIMFDGNVRNGGDFGINVVSLDIPSTLPIDGVTVTFWGVPASAAHDPERVCNGVTGCQSPGKPNAFLTIPTSCPPAGVGLKTVVKADAWRDPGVFVERPMISHLPPGYPLAPSEWGAQQGTTGCDAVPFDPSVSVEPTNHQADTPTGVDIDFKLPQEGLLNPLGIATSNVKKTVVTLPEGISVSPSAANGLGACSLEQIGLDNGNQPACPDSSKLGTVEIDSPLMEVPLQGYIYLAEQDHNPFGSLMAIYLAAKAHGVMIKLAGRVELDPRTGRLVTTVENSPQLPFEELKVDFKGGPRSPLVNPHTCGSYTASAEMTPWSGNPPVTIQSTFQITTGPGGAPCPNALQFAPSFAIGTTNNQAGAFSPLSLTMNRADGDQQLGGVSMTMPTGLLGTLSSVSLCGEPQASQGTCGPDSQIGTLTAGAGAGPTPFYVTGGKVYLTGPYKGAPFGLSVVVPAKAGPFDLGTVVVRGTVSVDPHTAALTVSTDPLPTILQGIPLDLRLINVSIDRPGFIFNPTDCNPMRIDGTLTGGQGLVESVSSSFQVTNCAALAFTPAFKVSTNGKTSRANGASLNVKLTFPAGSFGRESNIAKVKVDLPKQLPSRLETLQKACPGEVFQANPAACPAASKIGIARARTPILPEELSGPMYFVSHGGEAWPDLVIVLQGYHVTVQLVGTTFISKAGITSTTFKTIPDVAVESFQLTLPQGRDSALAANGNLCASALKMPTSFVAQDGAEIHANTPIGVTGCAKHKARQARRHGHGRKGRKK